MKLTILFLLLPLFSFSQTIFLADATTTSNKTLGQGYGGKLTIANSIYHDTYLGIGAEYIKYNHIPNAVVPATLNLLYAPKQSKSSIAPMESYSIGYSFFERSGDLTGWFYTSLYTGIKTTNKKLAPYFLVGITNQRFAIRNNDKITETPSYNSLSFKLGLSL